MERPQDIPPAPTEPCHVCGHMIFYLRRGVGKPQWQCMRCHPPTENDEKGEKHDVTNKR